MKDILLVSCLKVVTILTLQETQYQHASHLVPRNSHDTNWERLFNHQDNLALLIIPFILITYTLDHPVLLQGESRG